MNRIKEVLAEKEISQTWLVNELGKSFNRQTLMLKIESNQALKFYFK